MRYSSPGFLLKSDLYGGDLGTRPKYPKKYVWGLRSSFISRDFCSSAVGYSAKKKKKFGARSKKKLF